MTTSEFLIEHLSYYDMASWIVYTVLLVFFVFALLSFMFEGETELGFIAVIPAGMVTVVVWFAISLMQVAMLDSDLYSIASVEKTLRDNPELRPHPSIVAFQNHQDELLATMKDTGSFGAYGEIFDQALSASSRGLDHNNVFHLTSAYKSCFNVDEISEEFLKAVRTYPLDVENLESTWNSAVKVHGVNDPACYPRNIIKIVQ